MSWSVLSVLCIARQPTAFPDKSVRMALKPFSKLGREIWELIYHLQAGGRTKSVVHGNGYDSSKSSAPHANPPCAPAAASKNTNVSVLLVRQVASKLRSYSDDRGRGLSLADGRTQSWPVQQRRRRGSGGAAIGRRAYRALRSNK